MADHGVPHFQNDTGVPEIRIGAREFMCVGANPPLDHPHIFLDMGAGSDAVCPYCSTHFVYDASLKSGETVPAGCTFEPSQAAA